MMILYNDLYKNSIAEGYFDGSAFADGCLCMGISGKGFANGLLHGADRLAGLGMLFLFMIRELKTHRKYAKI